MPATPDDGPGRLDVDAAFAEIVARWGEAPADRSARPAPAEDPTTAEDGAAEDPEPGTAPGPAAPDRGAAPPGADRADRARHRRAAEAGGTDRAPRHARPAADVPPLPPAPVEPPFAAPPDPPRPRSGAVDDRDDLDEVLDAALAESFVPAEPRPLPRDLLGWAAWSAVLLAPLVLLVVALAWRDAPRLLMLATAALFVAGFVTLVVRLPARRDTDDDDGAVV